MKNSPGVFWSLSLLPSSWLRVYVREWLLRGGPALILDGSCLAEEPGLAV